MVKLKEEDLQRAEDAELFVLGSSCLFFGIWFLVLAPDS